MTINLPLSEKLTYSTVRIECEFPSGDIGTGTGFFHQFAKLGEENVPAIVTNKHVIDEAKTGRIHFHRADKNGDPVNKRFLSVGLENMQSHWILHPDPEVDLCVMPIAPLLTHIESRGENVFFISLDHSLIPSQDLLSELTAIEDVIMIGYPIGIWDQTNNMPIVRKGITATHPCLDYNGKQEFMIDAACFPGSSGSPVLLFNPGMYVRRDGNPNLGSRLSLLGILYAGPQYTATGEIKIVEVPTQQKPVALSRIPTNLGLVIRSEKLVDFDPVLQKLAQSREATEQPLHEN